MNRIFQRSWVSPVVAVSYAAVSITGLMMFFHLRGPSINFLHEWGGIVFVAAGLIHLFINWRAFLSCIRKPFGIAAVIVCSLICLGIILSPEQPQSHGSDPGFRHGRHESVRTD